MQNEKHAVLGYGYEIDMTLTHITKLLCTELY